VESDSMSEVELIKLQLEPLARFQAPQLLAQTEKPRLKRNKERGTRNAS